MKCKLSNADLISKSKAWIKNLCETGGRSWVLQVPVNFEKDPDILFSELCNRLDETDPKVPETPHPKKPFIVANVREVLNQFDKGEITFSRMAEMLNEMAANWYNKQSPKVDAEEVKYRACRDAACSYAESLTNMGEQEKEYAKKDFLEGISWYRKQYASIKCAEKDKRIEQLEKEVVDWEYERDANRKKINDLTLENERLRCIITEYQTPCIPCPPLANNNL